MQVIQDGGILGDAQIVADGDDLGNGFLFKVFLGDGPFPGQVDADVVGHAAAFLLVGLMHDGVDGDLLQDGPEPAGVEVEDGAAECRCIQMQ